MKSIDFFSWKIGALLYLIASILFGIEMVYAIQIKNVENIGISDLAGFLYFSILNPLP